jgi:hypothetical protein
MDAFKGATGFDWNEGNSRKSTDKHDIGQAEAEQVFLNEPLFVLEDARHSQLEPRFHALGHTDAKRLLHITFTLRGSGKLIRIISARTMHTKERETYDKKNKENPFTEI